MNLWKKTQRIGPQRICDINTFYVEAMQTTSLNMVTKCRCRLLSTDLLHQVTIDKQWASFTAFPLWITCMFRRYLCEQSFHITYLIHCSNAIARAFLPFLSE